MIEYFQGLPYPIAVAALFVIVVLRAGASYGIGRGVEAGANRTRMRRLLEGDRFRRVRALIERWGAPLVALSFLTIGFQTAANVAAGVARMPLRRYLPALGVGGLIWAVLYASAGVLGYAGFVQLYELSPVTAIVVTVGLAVVVAAFVVARRRPRPDRDEEHRDPGSAPDTAAGDAADRDAAARDADTAAGRRRREADAGLAAHDRRP